MDGAAQVSLEYLLHTSDFVFLTLPLTHRTRHLIGAEQFHMMKPTSFLVNVSANELINADALRSALTGGVIAGAALDVVGSVEQYLDLPNLTITPARAWYTNECLQRRAEVWIDTLASCLRPIG
jgi:D-3-phosphoglycerate dehydrogenase / 2-oxoglutarate reductase